MIPLVCRLFGVRPKTASDSERKANKASHAEEVRVNDYEKKRVRQAISDRMFTQPAHQPKLNGTVVKQVATGMAFESAADGGECVARGPMLCRAVPCQCRAAPRKHRPQAHCLSGFGAFWAPPRQVDTVTARKLMAKGQALAPPATKTSRLPARPRTTTSRSPPRTP